MTLRAADVAQHSTSSEAVTAVLQPSTQTMAVGVEEAAPPPVKHRHKWYRPAPTELTIIIGFTLAVYLVAVAGLDPHRSDVYHFVARGTGFVAYGFLTLAVALGTLLATRWKAYERPWLLAERLHPNILLLAISFLSFHLAGLLFNHFSWLVAFVPLVPSNRVIKAAMGITAMYLMIALTVSTYLIGYIGFRVWRIIHYFAYLSWLLATVHGILAGSDTGSWWAKALYVGSALLVALLTSAYLAGRFTRTRRVVSSSTAS